MQNIEYTRLYADEHGQSHFAQVAADGAQLDAAVRSAPVPIAAFFPASRCGFVYAPATSLEAGAHPAPRRQILCTVRGEYEIVASDGTVRRFPPGRTLLLEDTTGIGHTTRVIGGGDLVLLVIVLEDE
jgi:hypothetical protein